MSDNWLKDLLDFVGIDSGTIVRKTDKRALYESRIDNLEKKIAKENRSSRTLKTMMGSNLAITILGFFIFSHFLPNLAFLAWIYFIFSGSVFGLGVNNSKERIKEYKREIEKLEKKLKDLNDRPDISTSPYDLEPKDTGTESGDDTFIDAETERAEAIAKYKNSIREAALTYGRMDMLKDITDEIKNKDQGLGALFDNAYMAALKVRQLIEGDKDKENKAFMFYNHVETLHKWGVGVYNLFDAEVYDSLLTNIRSQAEKAIPVLQEKINAEYYKLVYPSIMDIEAEMEVMSKEKNN